MTDEAELFFKHFQLTALNYIPAWELLVSRYENTRILVNTQLRMLVEQNKVQSNTATPLKRLLDTTVECLYSLQNLGLDTSTWDSLLIYMTVQKITPDTHFLWEQSLASVNEHPTWRQFVQFLEARYQTLDGKWQKKNIIVEIMQRCDAKFRSLFARSLHS